MGWFLRGCHCRDTAGVFFCFFFFFLCCHWEFELLLYRTANQAGGDWNAHIGPNVSEKICVNAGQMECVREEDCHSVSSEKSVDIKKAMKPMWDKYGKEWYFNCHTFPETHSLLLWSYKVVLSADLSMIKKKPYISISQTMPYLEMRSFWQATSCSSCSERHIM